MPYARTNFRDLEARDIEGLEPKLRAVGYQLQPEKMRPSVWEFAPGDSNDRHRQREQEELYVILEGTLEMTVDEETFTLTTDDCVVVPPDSWRQLTATEQSRVLVVGAPNVADDAVDDADS